MLLSGVFILGFSRLRVHTSSVYYTVFETKESVIELTVQRWPKHWGGHLLLLSPPVPFCATLYSLCAVRIWAHNLVLHNLFSVFVSSQVSWALEPRFPLLFEGLQSFLDAL